MPARAARAGMAMLHGTTYDLELNLEVDRESVP